MGQFCVVYDACVLYPAPLRSFLMYLAITNLFRARWTNEIHEEWMRNVRSDYPDISRKQAERIRDLMNQAVLEPLVTGYESRILALVLPDPDDRHVLAAAIHCGANAIVTFNLRDFPKKILQNYDIEALHPDDFVVEQLELSPGLVCRAAKEQRASLKKPALSVDEYLASLQRQGLPQTVASLREYAELI
jgi:predicted nucleic acid-binding protein